VTGGGPPARVRVEVGGIGPGAQAAKQLSDLGTEVLRLELLTPAELLVAGHPHTAGGLAPAPAPRFERTPPAGVSAPVPDPAPLTRSWGLGLHDATSLVS
jgi:hypothetical protein